MMRSSLSASLLLALGRSAALILRADNNANNVSASYATAQGPPGGFSSGSNPYTSGSDPSSGGNNNSGYGSFGAFGSFFGINKMVTAHAVCATVAFGLLFPSGGIMIRLGNFRGLWLVHGIFQMVAYIIYIAAAAIGIHMATHMRMMHNAHPIIGLALLVLLLFQPFLGFIHHFAFKKHSKRVFWSYAHIWLGRIVITLGIVNGGLGLQLAKKTGFFAPTQSAIIGYSVAAGIVWLLYVASAVFGERKRSKSKYMAVGQAPPPYKEERDGQRVQYA